LLRSLLRPLAILATLAGLAAYATIMLRGPQGLSALEERRQEVRVLEEQNANLARDIAAKKRQIQRLKSDPGTQQVAIREALGKVHSGDTEFKIPGRRKSTDGR